MEKFVGQDALERLIELTKDGLGKKIEAVTINGETATIVDGEAVLNIESQFEFEEITDEDVDRMWG